MPGSWDKALGLTLKRDSGVINRVKARPMWVEERKGSTAITTNIPTNLFHKIKLFTFVRPL